MTTLLDGYRKQKQLRLEGNIYRKTQVELVYNSNHIEGSRLTQEQTRQIFETKTVDGLARIDDIKETSNHFRVRFRTSSTSTAPSNGSSPSKTETIGSHAT